MRRVLGGVATLVCVALLTSCSLLAHIPTPGNDNSVDLANVQMQRIANAVTSDDAAALKRVFSTTARTSAPDLDSGLKYFLSLFPDRRITWYNENSGGGAGEDNAPDTMWASYCYFKVSANGKDYEVYFTLITIDTDHPNNVGIYALGMTPYTANSRTKSGAAKPFYAWVGSEGLNDDDILTGVPGVYVPEK